MLYRLLWVLAAGLLISGEANAAAWLDCFNSANNQSTLDKGRCATWTETGTADSALLTVNAEGSSCDNTGTEPFTVWRANCDTGLATNIWWTTTDGADCSDSTLDDCGTVELPPGCYIIIPDATGASATCKAGPGNQ